MSKERETYNPCLLVIFFRKKFTKWYYKKRYPLIFTTKKAYLLCPWYIKIFSFLFSIEVFEEENKKYNEYAYNNYKEK